MKILLGCIIAFVIFIYAAIGFATSVVFISSNKINVLNIFLAITGVILWPLYVVLGNIIAGVQKKGEK